jgi:hypothetical protein
MFEALRRLFTGKTAEERREERESKERQRQLTQALLPHYAAMKQQHEERLRYIARLTEEIAKEEANGRPTAPA